MKTIVKLLAAALAALLTAAVVLIAAPVASFAEDPEVIDTVDVLGYVKPKAGDSVAENLAGLYTAEGCGYEIALPNGEAMRTTAT